MDREKVDLTGAPATMLATLYSKAMDSRAPDSVLHDETAARAVDRIEYDFARTGLRERDGISAVLRSKEFDRRAQAVLDRHAELTVLHLGCGLDTRVYRLAPPPTVAWYDIDYPEVIALRRRLYPERPGLRMIGSSVTDPGLLADIPGDRPVLVIAEGVTLYLRTAEGLATFRRVVEHFPAGTLIFDGYSSAGIWVQQRTGVVKASGSRLEWAIDAPGDLVREVPGLVFDQEWWFPGPADLRAHYPWFQRQVLRALFASPFKRLGRGLTYHFGSPS
ncbi:class I SAM-dependent methyltransferase [Crossiella sp. CA198]|uniref:class I SAM-dependent methyltransferase n=1 Tax=Crossiella sp. CA198 TaxID=3455607 RepID=UPI003F8D3E44